MKKRRAKKVSSSLPHVAVIGLGYVGLPTALAFAARGLRVTGIDVNRTRVRAINAGKSFIREIPDEALHRVRKNFVATTDWNAVRRAEVVLIAVPTPLTAHKTPDTSAIESAAARIARHLRRGTLVVLESTTYPGTTDELLRSILERSGLRAGKDFSLAFAPERIDPGNTKYRLTDVPKVVGGIDTRSLRRAAAFYRLAFARVHPVSSARTAEMTKLVENIFRLVNISLVNELKMIADKMGIDMWEVIEAAKTKPYGFMPFYPGPGVGGHCIPLDPFYLSWKAREFNFFTRFIDLAGEINELMPHHVVTKVIWALNQNKKSLRGSTVLLLGVAYKKDIDDPRESPALDILWDLTRKGAKVLYHDPYIAKVAAHGKTFVSSPLTPRLLRRADCVVVVTDHSSVDYRAVARHAKLVVDMRNAVPARRSRIIR